MSDTPNSNDSTAGTDAGASTGEGDYTAEERAMIADARARNIPASELISRASRDYHREQQGSSEPATPPASTPAEDDIPTVRDVSTMVERAVANATAEQRREAAKTEIASTISQVIERDGRFAADPADRRQITSEAVRVVREKAGLGKLDGPAFTQALQEATQAEIDRRAGKGGGGKDADRAELNSRLTAAAKAGETGGGHSRSGGQGSTTGAMRNLDGYEMEFGPGGKWPSDAELDQASKRDATAFLRKARGARA
jgi:hypothetical protein